MTMSSADRARVLVVDDDLGVIASYRYVFERFISRMPRQQQHQMDLEHELFGSAPVVETRLETPLEFDYADSGTAALRKVQIALQQGLPHSVIFLDMRMPPGPNGLMTAEAIRRLDRQVHIVFVTGYSDYESDDIHDRIRPPERLHYMQKPVKPDTLRWTVSNLTKLWMAEQQAS